MLVILWDKIYNVNIKIFQIKVCNYFFVIRVLLLYNLKIILFIYIMWFIEKNEVIINEKRVFQEIVVGL